MLWNEIFAFYIKYIFGGYYGGQSYWASIQGSAINTASLSVPLFGSDVYLGNYLSFVATIITLVVLVVLCCLLIKKIYNICAHVIG